MHSRTGGLAAILLATFSLAAAAPGLAQEASAGAGASGVPAASTSTAGSPGPLQPGTAQIRTSGLVDAQLVLPLQPEMTTITDSTAEIRFQDATLDTLNISLTIDSRGVSDAFVGVGVPGTSIFESAYFADFLHTQCTTTVTTLELTHIAGTITCADLGNGDDSGTVSLDAAFDTGVIAAPSPSASPLG